VTFDYFIQLLKDTINKMESNANAGSGYLAGLTTLLLRPSSSVHPDVSIRLVASQKVFELSESLHV